MADEIGSPSWYRLLKRIIHERQKSSISTTTRVLKCTPTPITLWSGKDETELGPSGTVMLLL